MPWKPPSGCSIPSAATWSAVRTWTGNWMAFGVGRDREVRRSDVLPGPGLRGGIAWAAVHQDPAIPRGLVGVCRDRAALVEVGQPLGQLLERGARDRVGHVRDVDAERVDRDDLLEAAGIDREQRRRGVRDLVAPVIALGDAQLTLAEGHLEGRLDLLLGEVRGPEAGLAEDGAERRRAFLGRVPEDDRAVAVEREDRRLAGEEARHDEAAALVVAQKHVGCPGRVLDGAEGSRTRARRDRG